MAHYPGQFTMYFPNGQPGRLNGYTQVNGGAVPANNVPARTPPQQPQLQYQPMTPRSTPRRLPVSPWVGAMPNTHGQRQPSVQNQTAGLMSPFHAAQSNAGQQPCGRMNNLPSSYTATYGNIAQPYQYNIPSDINFDLNAGFQSALINASQNRAQLQSILDNSQMLQARNVSTKAKDDVLAVQRRQMEQQRILLQQQTARQQQAAARQAMQQQIAQQKFGHQQPTPQESARQYASSPALNYTPPSTTVNGQTNNSVMSPSFSSLNGRQPYNASPIASMNVQRNSLPMTPASSPMNVRQQQTRLMNITPAANMPHMPTLNKQVGQSPVQKQGKKRQADPISNDNGSPSKKPATGEQNRRQDPNRYKTPTALEQLYALKVQATRQAQLTQQKAEQHAKLRKEQEERDSKRLKEQEERDAKLKEQQERDAKLRKEQQERDAELRKEQKEHDTKLRQEQEELQREYQRKADLRLKRERHLARKEELKKDETALYRHYIEYMGHFPYNVEEDKSNQYLFSLLANRAISEKDRERRPKQVIAIEFAKEHWDWFMEYPKDIPRAYEEAMKAKTPKGD